MDNSFPENEILIIITIGIIVMLLFALTFILFFYFSQKRFQAERLKAQEVKIQHQEQLLFNNIQTQEKERQRIARELHDEVGSKLNVINLGLHQLAKITDIQKEDTEILNELFDVISNTINATREISHDLLPPTLEKFGLELALEELCENYRKASAVNIRFEVIRNDGPIADQSIALNIFRIVQELMANTLKYAEADQIDLNLWMGHKESRIMYKDNGNGFDLENINYQKGLGLQNIESRIRMIGAEYTIESSEGNGVFFQLQKICHENSNSR